MGARRLLKEGLLIKTKSGRKIYAFLCSDILVLTDEAMKTLYRMVSCQLQPWYTVLTRTNSRFPLHMRRLRNYRAGETTLFSRSVSRIREEVIRLC